MGALFIALCGLVGVALLVGGGLGWLAWGERRSRRSMALVAQRLGLKAEVDGSGWRMQGAVDGVEVAVERSTGPFSGGAMRLSLRCPGIPGDVFLRTEERPGWPRPPAACDGLQVGDPAFDGRICLYGSQDAALAVLRESARKAVLELSPAICELALARDGLSAELRGPGPGPDGLERRLRAFVDLAKHLAVGPVREALAANALSDPAPGVRVRNLEALLEVCDGAFAEAVLGRSLQDPDETVRRFARGALAGPPGKEKE